MSSSFTPYRVFEDPLLLAAGLNLHAVMSVAQLPEPVRDALGHAGVEPRQYPSLILFGNGGPGFWEACRQAWPAEPHPVDVCSRNQVAAFMARQFPGAGFRFLYPGGAVVPLQALGRVAGWHHDSPMKVGINDTWGLWYAYRALVAVDVALPASAPVVSASPCVSCHDKPCIKACPAQALVEQDLRLERCIDFRLQPESVCGHQCLARWACPVAAEHRYAPEQVQYHYGHSLPHLQQWRSGQKGS